MQIPNQPMQIPNEIIESDDVVSSKKLHSTKRKLKIRCMQLSTTQITVLCKFSFMQIRITPIMAIN